MILRKNCIAIRALAFLGLLLIGTVAYAGQTAGTVTHLSGPLLAKKADGAVKALSQKSVVEQGDILVTEKDTYARIQFIDNSEMTLRPNTQFKIDKFSFDEGKPENDSAVFSLIKGGLRAITGLLGKRNKERFGMNTPAATIGIRGTTFIVEYVEPTQASVAAFGFASVAALSPSMIATTDDPVSDVPVSFDPYNGVKPLQLALGLSGSPGAAPGLYVQVIDGVINLTNKGGSQNFSAGQFGFTPSFTQPPVVLPNNPGLHFTPPPAFFTNLGAPGGTTGGSSSAAVDCEVR